MYLRTHAVPALHTPGAQHPHAGQQCPALHIPVSSRSPYRVARVLGLNTREQHTCQGPILGSLRNWRRPRPRLAEAPTEQRTRQSPTLGSLRSWRRPQPCTVPSTDERGCHGRPIRTVYAACPGCLLSLPSTIHRRWRHHSRWPENFFLCRLQ